MQSTRRREAAPLNLHYWVTQLRSIETSLTLCTEDHAQYTVSAVDGDRVLVSIVFRLGNTASTT